MAIGMPSAALHNATFGTIALDGSSPIVCPILLQFAIAMLFLKITLTAEPSL